MLTAAQPFAKLARPLQKPFFDTLRTALRDAVLSAAAGSAPLLPALQQESAACARALSIDKLLALDDFICTLASRTEINVSAASLAASLTAGAYTICYGG
jgi:hypothetical protein